MVYLPDGTPCGQADPFHIQLLAHNFRNRAGLKYGAVKQSDSIVLIQRTHSRNLVQHAEVASFLGELAKDFGLNFLVFSDKNKEDDNLENTIKVRLVSYRT